VFAANGRNAIVAAAQKATPVDRVARRNGFALVAVLAAGMVDNPRVAIGNRAGSGVRCSVALIREGPARQFGGHVEQGGASAS
jgi:hypothetical protein